MTLLATAETTAGTRIGKDDREKTTTMNSKSGERSAKRRSRGRSLEKQWRSPEKTKEGKKRNSSSKKRSSNKKKDEKQKRPEETSERRSSRSKSPGTLRSRARSQGRGKSQSPGRYCTRNLSPGNYRGLSPGKHQARVAAEILSRRRSDSTERLCLMEQQANNAKQTPSKLVVRSKRRNSKDRFLPSSMNDGETPTSKSNHKRSGSKSRRCPPSNDETLLSPSSHRRATRGETLSRRSSSGHRSSRRRSSKSRQVHQNLESNSTRESNKTRDGSLSLTEYIQSTMCDYSDKPLRKPRRRRSKDNGSRHSITSSRASNHSQPKTPDTPKSLPTNFNNPKMQALLGRVEGSASNRGRNKSTTAPTTEATIGRVILRTKPRRSRSADFSLRGAISSLSPNLTLKREAVGNRSRSNHSLKGYRKRGSGLLTSTSSGPDWNANFKSADFARNNNSFPKSRSFDKNDGFVRKGFANEEFSPSLAKNEEDLFRAFKESLVLDVMDMERRSQSNDNEDSLSSFFHDDEDDTFVFPSPTPQPARRRGEASSEELFHRSFEQNTKTS